ncbi:hypothetical protein LCGC14_0373600 [marine sediment metagenome]|uniref:Recombination endonuclease VII n=1 Tax=marine sediment metagenome TaxID=412755 RepID=A0A0F9T4L5_9ZZZZ
MRRCSKCKTEKPESGFYADKWQASGFRSSCKECDSNYRSSLVTRQNRTAYTRKYYKKNAARLKAAQRAWRLKREFGITVDDWDQMLNDQNGECKICQAKHENDPRGLFVDHCHETGVVRGLLCFQCNTGIGHLQHSIIILESAKKYLSAC